MTIVFINTQRVESGTGASIKNYKKVDKKKHFDWDSSQI